MCFFRTVCVVIYLGAHKIYETYVIFTLFFKVSFPLAVVIYLSKLQLMVFYNICTTMFILKLCLVFDPLICVFYRYLWGSEWITVVVIQYFKLTCFMHYFSLGKFPIGPRQPQTHTHTHTVSKTPLKEGSALYLRHTKQTKREEHLCHQRDLNPQPQ
jgi:hypothetical protein